MSQAKPVEADSDPEFAALTAEHAALEAEHARLKDRPHDIEGHLEHSRRLHAHLGRLHRLMAARGMRPPSSSRTDE